MFTLSLGQIIKNKTSSISMVMFTLSLGQILKIKQIQFQLLNELKSKKNEGIHLRFFILMPCKALK